MSSNSKKEKSLIVILSLLFSVIIIVSIIMIVPNMTKESYNSIKENKLKWLTDISKYDLNKFKEIGKVVKFKTYDNDYNYQEIIANDKTIFVNIKHEEIPLNSEVLTLNEKRIDVYCFSVDGVISICRMGK